MAPGNPGASCMSQCSSRNIKTSPCCNKGWENKLVPVRLTEALYLLLVPVARAWVPLAVVGARGALKHSELSLLKSCSRIIHEKNRGYSQFTGGLARGEVGFTSSCLEQGYVLLAQQRNK